MASRIEYVLNILSIIVLLILVFLLVRVLGMYVMYVVQPYGERDIKIILKRCQETTSHQEFLDLCRKMKDPGALSIVPTSEGIRMETSPNIFGSYTCLIVEFLEENRLKLTVKEKNNYLNRKEIIAFYNKLEPGMADMEVITAFREMNPHLLFLNFTRSGYTVQDMEKFFGPDWRLDIVCRDGSIQSLKIREGNTEKRPEKAPPDKTVAKPSEKASAGDGS